MTNLHEASPDVVGSVSFWGDNTDLSSSDGKFCDANRRLLNGFCGVPWKKLVGSRGQLFMSCEVHFNVLNLWKTMKLQIECGSALKRDKWAWDIRDHRQRGGFGFHSWHQ